MTKKDKKILESLKICAAAPSCKGCSYREAPNCITAITGDAAALVEKMAKEERTGKWGISAETLLGKEGSEDGEREEGQKRTRKVFDWDKAAKIIREKNAESAMAGVRNDFDWEWTGGIILEKGEPVFSCGDCLETTFGVPEIVLMDDEGFYTMTDAIECYKEKCGETDRDNKRAWPESALKILKGEAHSGKESTEK